MTVAGIGSVTVVGVDAGQVQSQLKLGGSGLRGRLGEDAQAAGDDVAGVADHREGQAVLHTGAGPGRRRALEQPVTVSG
jgi:hypothetical protein